MSLLEEALGAYVFVFTITLIVDVRDKEDEAEKNYYEIFNNDKE